MSRKPEPFRSLSGEIKKDRAGARSQGNASPYTGTGVHPDGAGGVVVEGNLTVTSGVSQSGNYVAGVSGWATKGDGDAEFNDVTIRGILVGLDAPVQQKTYKSPASAFSLGVPWVEKAGQDITVPVGCTRASADVRGRMYAINPNTTGGADSTGTDALYIRVGINGLFSAATPTGISGSNGFATTIALDAFDLTGLTPGSTIRLSVQGSCGYQPIAASADNYIVGIVSLTWMR